MDEMTSRARLRPERVAADGTPSPERRARNPVGVTIRSSTLVRVDPTLEDGPVSAHGVPLVFLGAIPGVVEGDGALRAPAGLDARELLRGG